MTKYFLTVLKFAGYDERRKARNFLLQPVLQMKLTLYTLILSFIFVSLAMVVGFNYFEQLYVMMLENTTQGSYLRDAISIQTENFMEASLILLVWFILLMTLVTIVYTHKIIGPTVAMRRHVRALKDGLYSHRINLRKNDELKDLAEDLNELAEMLEQHKDRGTADN